MAKPATVKIKLVSTADTGFFYVTKKNPRNQTEKMSFRKYDPANRLLTQAEQEVLSQELELGRLTETLQRLSRWRRQTVTLTAPSPFALPLMIERLREQLSTEKLKDRLDRLLAQSEAALADAPPPRRRFARRD